MNTLRNTFFFVLTLLSLNAYSQADSLFLDINMNEINASQDHEYVLIYKEGIKEKISGIIEIRDKNGLLIESVNYKKGIENGDYYKLDINTNYEYRGVYKRGVKTGTWLLTDQQGNMVVEERYNSDGSLKSIESSSKELGDIKIYEEDEVDEPAYYAQGEYYWKEHLRLNLRYPRDASRAGKEGEVFTEIVILPNGLMGQIKDVSANNRAKSLTNESIRVILSAGHWIPAKVNGKPVASKRTIRMVFKLK